MRNRATIGILLCTLISVCIFSFKENDDNLKSDFSHYFEKSVSSFLLSYDSLYKYVNTTKDIDSTLARKLFENTRYAYKRNELMIEYFAPSTAAMLNMALIPDVDEYDPNQYTQEPEGLQRMEELLYDFNGNINQDILLQELKRTRGAILRAQQIAKTLEPTEYQLFEASRQELIRIWTINLTGIDASYTKNAILETKHSLHTVVDMINLLDKNSKNRKFAKKLKEAHKITLKAEVYLINNNDFDSFNRIEFIKNFINPIYSILVDVEQSLTYSKNEIPTAIYAVSRNILNASAWNTYYFSSAKRNTSNENIVNLGKLLFYDPILSGNNKRACASCHRADNGFAEPLEKSVMFGQDGFVGRNAPTLLNTALQKAYFHDARTTYLEDQVVEVNQNTNEMHGNFNLLVQKLNGSDEYVSLFKKSFYGTEDTTISKDGIIKAIAAYERTLISMNSKFDRYMRNEKVELTSSEKNGFNLFMGKAQCGTCHFAPLFNGTVPPNFDETEWEIIGTPENNTNTKLDEDKGRYNVAKMDIHQFAFKTPTIRNIEYTAPYMHNGAYKNLDEIVDFYNNGGGIGHGYHVPNQTLPSDSLKLSKVEMKDIVSFMNTLSDTVGLTKKPSRLPVVKVAGQIVSRKIGGEY